MRQRPNHTARRRNLSLLSVGGGLRSLANTDSQKRNSACQQQSPFCLYRGEAVRQDGGVRIALGW